MQLRVGDYSIANQEVAKQLHAIDGDDKLNVQMPFAKFLCFLIRR